MDPPPKNAILVFGTPNKGTPHFKQGSLCSSNNKARPWASLPRPLPVSEAELGASPTGQVQEGDLVGLGFMLLGIWVGLIFGVFRV